MNDDFFDRLQPIYEVYARVVEGLMRRRHVVACGIGLKVINGEVTNIPSLVISVKQKASTTDLSDEDIIPSRIDDVDTDVIETGEIRALNTVRTVLMRPVRPGLSIGHMNGSAGTAGCVVRRGDEVFMLTNNHVVALVNKGRLGDPILQPGPQDGGTTLNTFGQLAEFIPIQLLEATGVAAETEAASQSAEDDSPAGCAGLLASLFGNPATSPGTLTGSNGQPISDEAPSMVRVNRVDAALVRPIDGIMLDPTIIDVATPPAGVDTVSLGDIVMKSGRTSGLTQGTVMQIDVTVDVTYDDGKARFTNQLMATPFSQRGDSGSLVMDTSRNAVGLIFSGSDSVSVFHPIQTVLNELNVEIVTS